MIYGNSMNNIWKNARYLNNLVTQIETGKKIQRPSDDPLIASRALRYRTILAEAEQFLANTKQGMAWMEVSEAALNSILTGNSADLSSMHRINELLVEGATGSNELSDQLAILAEIRQSFDQMFGVDMNQTYLGRYVFSGFHTNQPPVLKTDWPGRSFLIQQNFLPGDIEKTMAFHRPSETSPPQEIRPNPNILKLPYTDASFAFNSANGSAGITLADRTPFHIVEIDSYSENAYRPESFFDGRPVIHHVYNTGELVMSDEVRALIENAGGLNVTYEKNNLKTDELNPIVYFPSIEIINGVPTHRFDTAGQGIQMEISNNSYITINSHARDILTANLYSDLRRLFDFADSLQLTDPAQIENYYIAQGFVGENLLEAKTEFLSNEKSLFADAMHDRFNNMLKSFEAHFAQTQRELTNLGTRMSRLEMVSIRLEEDGVAFTDLLSQNEDADIVSTMKRLEGAETAFSHALMAIARTTQLSLADFINR
jgi:flagellar hook-associated protein 3 FlgL